MISLCSRSAVSFPAFSTARCQASSSTNDINEFKEYLGMRTSLSLPTITASNLALKQCFLGHSHQNVQLTAANSEQSSKRAFRRYFRALSWWWLMLFMADVSCERSLVAASAGRRSPVVCTLRSMVDTPCATAGSQADHRIPTRPGALPSRRSLPTALGV